MVFLTPQGGETRIWNRFSRPGFLPNRFDVLALCLIAGAAVLIAHGGAEMNRPLAALSATPVVLDPARLPGYALLTTLRMFAALFFSLMFTFVVATLAAKSRKAELVIIPALDILQSVPVLGFLTFTVTFFMNLFRGNQLGVECAAVFAIFTAQAWNMTFSFYQSLKTLPSDLEEAASMFGLSAWGRFWKLEAPFAMPGLIWNMMMSMSGAWFFVVASEAITVGPTTVTLPGVGAWLAVAIDRRDFAAVGWAVGAMVVVILLYDQLVFRPVVAWADKFRFETTAASPRPASWVYDALRRSRLLAQLRQPIRRVQDFLGGLPITAPARLAPTPDPKVARALDWGWIALVVAVAAAGAWMVFNYVAQSMNWRDALQAFELGLLTLVRVMVLIALASLIWVPVGVWIGLRPAWAEKVQAIAQILAAFPANLLFPIFVITILRFHLNPDIWLSPLMVLGTQWYILFNVIAGASALPGDMREATTVYHMRGWAWWRTFALPGIFPFYVTGALTASGGSWNAAIVAEVVHWGKDKVEAHGLGAFIADATTKGDFPRVVTGVAVMAVFVIAMNRTIWRPLYAVAERRFRLN
jgi:NitT/TauT family transport system permease protein